MIRLNILFYIYSNIRVNLALSFASSLYYRFISHVFSKSTTSPKHFEFLVVENGTRRFKGLQSDDVQTRPLSYQPDLITNSTL